MNFIERAVKAMEEAHFAARHGNPQSISGGDSHDSQVARDVEIDDSAPVPAIASPASPDSSVASLPSPPVRLLQPDQQPSTADVNDDDLDDDALERDEVDTYTGAVFRNSVDRVRASHVRALRAKIDEVEASVDQASVSMPNASTGAAVVAASQLPNRAASDPWAAPKPLARSVSSSTSPAPLTTDRVEPSLKNDPTDTNNLAPDEPGDVAEPAVPDGTIITGGKLRLKALHAQAYLDPDGREDRLREAFEPMADELLEQMSDTQASAAPLNRRIMVTSAEAGAGRSLCGIHLALSLAVDHDQSVIFIDIDLAGTPVVSSLGVLPGAGVADWLEGLVQTIDALVVPTELTGLKLVAPGSSAAVARQAGLLDRQAVNAFLLALSARYPTDLIVLAGPALLGNEDAVLLAGLSGQVVVVVAANETPRRQLQDALEALQRHSKVSLLLNKMRH